MTYDRNRDLPFPPSVLVPIEPPAAEPPIDLPISTPGFTATLQPSPGEEFSPLRRELTQRVLGPVVQAFLDSLQPSKEE